jgi:hypothetical protein
MGGSHLLNGDVVLFNRQPSLYRMSMMAPKSASWNTTLSGSTSYTSYNADFDGDEMNMHVPQSVTTSTRSRSCVARHIPTPRNTSHHRVVQTWRSAPPRVAAGVKIERKVFFNRLHFTTHDGVLPAARPLRAHRRCSSCCPPRCTSTTARRSCAVPGERLHQQKLYQQQSIRGAAQRNDEGPWPGSLLDNTQNLKADWLMQTGLVGIRPVTSLETRVKTRDIIREAKARARAHPVRAPRHQHAGGGRTKTPSSALCSRPDDVGERKAATEGGPRSRMINGLQGRRAQRGADGQRARPAEGPPAAAV